MDVRIFGRGSAGTTIPIIVRTRRKIPNTNERPFVKINGVSAKITGPNGSVVLSGGVFSYIQEGEYLFNWDTLSLGPGNYRVEVTVGTTLSGEKVTQSGIIRLY